MEGSRRPEPPRILLTGPPGCGKTTVILRTLALLGRPAAGFYTEEVRRGAPARPGAGRTPAGAGTGGRPGPRTGFDVVSLDGRRGPLARVGGPGPRVGRYGVDVPSFEAVGVRALEAALEDPRVLLVVDELGRMEFLSPAFRALLPRLFRAPNPLLGTVLSRPHPLADRYRGAPGVEVVEVGRGNREALPGILAGRFTGPQAGRGREPPDPA